MKSRYHMLIDAQCQMPNNRMDPYSVWMAMTLYTFASHAFQKVFSQYKNANTQGTLAINWNGRCRCLHRHDRK